jgi:hypothetical protein
MFQSLYHRFTDDSPIFSAGYVNTMKAHGGGDGPEAVTAALADAFNLPWRPNATKICALASWGTCKCWKMMINHVFGGIQFGEKTLFLFNHYVTAPCLCHWNVNDGVIIYNII